MNETSRVIDRLSDDGVMSRHVLAIAASISHRATRDYSRLKTSVYGFEDVFQELVIAALVAQRKGNYDPSEGTEAYYYRRVMINRLIELGDKQMKMRLTEVMLSQVFSGVDELVETTYDLDSLKPLSERNEFIDPEDVIAGVQGFIHAYEFTQTLEQVERDVLAYLMMGYTQDETGEYLGFSQTKVYRVKKSIEMKIIVYADVLGYTDWTNRWLETLEEGKSEAGKDIPERNRFRIAAVATTSTGTKAKNYKTSLAGTLSMRA